MKVQTVSKNKVNTLLSGVCFVVVGLQGVLGAADWPNYRGPNYDGISKETGWIAKWPAGGPKVLWKASLGTGFATMTVVGNRVYATGNIDNKDILYCFDADTGKEIWKQSYQCPLFAKNHEGGPSATPTVVGDVVYIFSKNGDVICFKSATGEIVWHKNLNKELGMPHPTWYFASSPFITDGLIILNAGDAGIALKTGDGSAVWQSGKNPASYATAVPFTIGDKKCVVICGTAEVMGVEVLTGKILWRYPWKTDYGINAADPIVAGDKIFISSGYNRGCALLKIIADGVAEVWKNKSMRNHFNSSVFWEGYIYGFDESTLKCLDFKTGQEKWAQEGLGKGSLMLADGIMIILSEKGELVTAKATPEKFEKISSAQILTGKCWTVPVLANGRIYARNAAGQLVCVDVRKQG
jgi:outer membrane protein assembly factor BamB